MEGLIFGILRYCAIVKVLHSEEIENPGLSFLASHAGVFRGARISFLPTNACSTVHNIYFPLFYLRGK